MQAAALVGHGVLVPGSGLMMQDGLAAGGFELSEPADSVHVTIKDKDGRVVRTLDLKELDAGITVFEWDGKADDGTPAANGEYTISVEAVRGDAAVSATTLQVGVVSSVLRGIQGALLTVGGLGEFRLDEIRQILSDTKKTT
jgi:flagellar basal-body rod modification protein FlgD